MRAALGGGAARPGSSGDGSATGSQSLPRLKMSLSKNTDSSAGGGGSAGKVGGGKGFATGPAMSTKPNKPSYIVSGTLKDSKPTDDFQNQDIGSSYRGSVQFRSDLFAKQWNKTQALSQRPADKYHSTLSVDNMDTVSNAIVYEKDRALWKEKVLRDELPVNPAEATDAKYKQDLDVRLEAEAARKSMMARAKWNQSKKIREMMGMFGMMADLGGLDKSEFWRAPPPKGAKNDKKGNKRSMFPTGGDTGEKEDEEEEKTKWHERSPYARKGDVFPMAQDVPPLMCPEGSAPRPDDIIYNKNAKLHKEKTCVVPKLMEPYDQHIRPGTREQSQAGHSFLVRHPLKRPPALSAKEACELLEEMGAARQIVCHFEDAHLQDVLAALEQMHADQRTQQQGCDAMDRLLKMIMTDRPEWRQKMAVLTKSQMLRRKILDVLPPGGRQVGSAMLGATHPWRSAIKKRDGKIWRANDENTWPHYALAQGLLASDHNWPKVDPVTGTLSRKFDDDKTRLPAPVEMMKQHPKLDNCPSYSFGKEKRRVIADPIHDIWTEVYCPQTKNSTPGPGDYSEAKGICKVPWMLNERVVLGSNEKYGCQGMLSDDITRLGQHACSPVYSFPQKSQYRSVAQGVHMVQSAAKSDGGNLSPGLAYEAYGSFRVKESAREDNRPARCQSFNIVDKAIGKGKKYEVGGRPYR
ncbi:unnamed protein product [Amoebophrya sp. A25]|nr:unnamed protein product [Amoebophrya sp. A25]|eukprot:GSA25T00000591001.1